MTIHESRQDDRLTLALEGRLDTVTSPEFIEALNKHLPTVSTMTVDLSGLDYISSAGLRALLIAHRSLEDRGGLTVLNPNELVREVFDVTGFSGVLNIK